jgi:hypothetical protein
MLFGNVYATTGWDMSMTIAPAIWFSLGAIAACVSILILIPIRLESIRSGGGKKTLAAAAVIIPLGLLAFLGDRQPETGVQPDVRTAANPLPALPAPMQGELKQDADWALITHAFLGGPPPGASAAGTTANGTTGPVAERAQQSVMQLAEVTRREPRNTEAWLALAQAHRIAREFPAASKAYETALKLDSSNADAWADYADALASGNNRSLVGAPAAAIAKALALNPGHLKALWLAASLDLEQHHYRDALSRWQELRSALPQGSPDITIIDANIAEAHQLAAKSSGRS